MLAADLLPAVEAYLRRPEVAAALDIAAASWQLSFLAQGEYNINYRLERASAAPLVVRVNTGSQIGKTGGAQIAYEAAALRLLGSSSLTPRLLYLDDTLAALPYGLLVMTFLPGGPLNYGDPTEITGAARTLAALHRVPAPADDTFILRRTLVDDLAEGEGWLASYLACERAPLAVRELFARILAHAAEDAQRYAGRFPRPFALVHTDVQAHNFVVERTAHGPICRLVDWERPLIDDPTYDLAHFIIPTTTRWKLGHSFTPAEIEGFLAAYCAARPDLDPDELRERLRIRRPFILLRAVSWCAGAWVDYTGPGRAIAHADTLARIEEYLQPDELRRLFPEWLG
jgi:Ser/Thr protein kinase RdoA (MazF antagonist)